MANERSAVTSRSPMKKEDQGGTVMSQREAGTGGRSECGLRVTMKGRVGMPIGQGRKDSR